MPEFETISSHDEKAKQGSDEEGINKSAQTAKQFRDLHTPTAQGGEAADSQEGKFPYSNKQKTDLTGDGGVVIRITGRSKKKGTLCQDGDVVIVQYVATQGADGTLFDSSRKHVDRGFKFKLGDRGPKAIMQPGMVRPRGWDIAIRTLRVGDSALVYLSPEYAFGDAGVRHPNRPGFIVPPGTHLMYNIEIVGIEKDFQSMTAVELLNKAESLLNQATEKFKLGEYEKATTRYDESLQLLQRIPKIRHDDIPICTEPLQVEGRQKIIRCLLNLATCKLKIIDTLVNGKKGKKSLKKSKVAESKDLAKDTIKICTKALDILQSTDGMEIKFFAKAHFRRGKAHQLLKNVAGAKNDFYSALKILPSDKAIRKEYMATKSILKERAVGERKIFKDVIKNSNTAFYSDKPEIKRKETWYEKVKFTAREVFVSIREHICSICCKGKEKTE